MVEEREGGECNEEGGEGGVVEERKGWWRRGRVVSVMKRVEREGWWRRGRGGERKGE